MYIILWIEIFIPVFLLQQNTKMQLSQSDLLKLLSYLEGELQARDVVIAALKVYKLCSIYSKAISIRLICIFFPVGKIEKLHQYNTT